MEATNNLYLDIFSSIYQINKTSDANLNVGHGILSISASFRNKFIHPNIVKKISEPEHKQMMECPFYYERYKVENETLENIADSLGMLMSGFLICLWLVKDSAASRGPLILIDNSKDRNFFVINHLRQYTTSDLRVSTSNFSDEELEKANKYSQHLDLFLSKLQPKRASNININEIIAQNGLQAPEVVRYDIGTTLERAIRFIEEARAAGSIPLKITNYIMALECFFTFERYKTNKRVSKRTANYIEMDDVSRNNTYSIVSNCYDIRSEYAHGQLLGENNSVENQLTAVKNIDDIVRRTVVKLIYNDIEKVTTATEDERKEWLDRIYADN